MRMTTDLQALARPFPERLIKKNPTGFGQYVKHSVVVEKLLATVGPFDYRIVELIRGDTKDHTNVVVGCIAELTVTIDGRPTTVQEVGDCERPENWPNDGARAKDCSSDAIKRCAMRVGVGIHLWSGDDFALARALDRNAADE